MGLHYKSLRTAFRAFECNYSLRDYISIEQPIPWNMGSKILRDGVLVISSLFLQKKRKNTYRTIMVLTKLIAHTLLYQLSQCLRPMVCEVHTPQVRVCSVCTNICVCNFSPAPREWRYNAILINKHEYIQVKGCLGLSPAASFCIKKKLFSLLLFFQELVNI